MAVDRKRNDRWKRMEDFTINSRICSRNLFERSGHFADEKCEMHLY
jgi:hypothetical protein